jgi:hypothetical protein
MDPETFEECELMATKHGLVATYFHRNGEHAFVISSDEIGYEHCVVGEIDPAWHETQFIYATRVMCEAWFSELERLTKKEKRRRGLVE